MAAPELGNDGALPERRHQAETGSRAAATSAEAVNGSENPATPQTPSQSPASRSRMTNIKNRDSVASTRQRAQELASQFEWIDMDLDVALSVPLSPPNPAFASNRPSSSVSGSPKLGILPQRNSSIQTTQPSTASLVDSVLSVATTASEAEEPSGHSVDNSSQFTSGPATISLSDQPTPIASSSTAQLKPDMRPLHQHYDPLPLASPTTSPELGVAAQGQTFEGVNVAPASIQHQRVFSDDNETSDLLYLDSRNSEQNHVQERHDAAVALPFDGQPLALRKSPVASPSTSSFGMDPRERSASTESSSALFLPPLAPNLGPSYTTPQQRDIAAFTTPQNSYPAFAPPAFLAQQRLTPIQPFLNTPDNRYPQHDAYASPIVPSPYSFRSEASPLTGPGDGRYSEYSHSSGPFADGASTSDASSTRRLMVASPAYGPSSRSQAMQRSGSSSVGYFDTSSPLASPPRNGGLHNVPSPSLPYAMMEGPRSPNPFLSSSDSLQGGMDEKGSYRSLATQQGFQDSAPDTATIKREKERQYAVNGWMPSKQDAKRKRKWMVIAGLVVVAAVVGGIAAYVALQKNKTSSTGSSGTALNDDAGHTSESSHLPAPTATATGATPTATPTWGGDGSSVTLANGTTFTYRNSFGGFWVSDPFNNSARAQSWTKPLSQQWDYSNDPIYGVNLGGWLTLEPFIVPAMFEPYEKASPPVVDEWMLSQALGDKLQSTLVEHYETFITEYDFARIAAAGLSWVRISLPYWAIETWSGEPFLEGVSWNYFQKAIVWARKYGLRINLDLHTIPGSQNGWNHSGRFGTVNFLNGVMGIANAQRTLNYIRVLTEFINQPEILPVVPMFGIINEPLTAVIGVATVRAFYLEAYNIIRSITGTGLGKGPLISIHDGFDPNLAVWEGYLAGSDRVVLDSHPYQAFNASNTRTTIQNVGTVCNFWAGMFNRSLNNFGLTYAGEWSLAQNDCGQYLNGVGQGVRYDGTFTGTPNVTGNCAGFVDASRWNTAQKAQLQDLALAYMDSFTNWFFWTWKIGTSDRTGTVPNPSWSYSLGLDLGYIPKDPRAHRGACYNLAAKYQNIPPPQIPYAGALAASATGGGNGQIDAAQTSTYGQWPPATIQNMGVSTIPPALNVDDLPTYTATAPSLVVTASPSITKPALHTPVLTSAYFTPIRGCKYPDAWGGAGGSVLPTAC